MDEEVIHGGQDEHCATQPEGDAVEFAFEEFFILAHFDSEVAEHATPDARAEEGVD